MVNKALRSSRASDRPYIHRSQVWGLGLRSDYLAAEQEARHLKSHSISANNLPKPKLFIFFPRASERRVLLIVGSVKHSHIFTSSHPHILTSSHLLIFTSSHLHICSSSHLLTSSHPHTPTSSHLLIFASSHTHIFTSSHPHILTSSHLLILTSSCLHILMPSHPHILTSFHLHIFTFSLALLFSCPLARSFFSISLLKARGSANETARNATLSHEMRFDRQKPQQNCDFSLPAQPFRTK